MIHFATFADGNFGIKQAGKRLLGEAKRSPELFQSARIFDLKDLDFFESGYILKHQNFISSHPRGFGLCFWKPTFLLAALEALGEGEILIALDAGCQFNLTPSSILRLHEYARLAQRHNALFMQLKDRQFGIQNLTDRFWCLEELIYAINPPIEHLESNQVQAGILIVKNCGEVRQFLHDWKNFCEVDGYYYLIGEQGTMDRQTRWEQSIFSLLVKKTNYQLIPDETYWFPNWSEGSDFPIWAMRNRSGGDAFRRNFADLFQIAIAKASVIAKKVITKK